MPLGGPPRTRVRGEGPSIHRHARPIDLHADGQTRSREPARHANCRQTGGHSARDSIELAPSERALRES